ncbi:MAG: SDR family oxidoreductase [Micromonosporaceae bacterium]|nr:SDR family oxidoreductase [Micromonosporaceae bacterium]
MRLVIFAATGGIGRHLLDQAEAAGHKVTAVARHPDRLSNAATAVRADLATATPEELESIVEGADAVLSGLGPRTRGDTGVASRGTRTIVSAMEATEVRRIVVVSAAPIGTVAAPGRPTSPRYDPGDGFFMRHLFSPFARVAFGRHYADLAVMEDLLRGSALDWTVVRPPRLTNSPITGRYRTAYGRNLPGGWRISRADVAHCILATVDQPESVRQVLGIAY